MRSKFCKTCNRRFRPTAADDVFCSEECKKEYEDQMDRFRRRAGNVMRKWNLSDEWKAIVDIMTKHNCQYPKAVEIYEKEKKK